MRKDMVSGSVNGIEINKDDQRVVIAENGITIRHEDKPLENEIVGYVYLVIDCSPSMTGNKLDQAKNGAKKFAADAKVKGYLVGLIQFDYKATHLCEPQRDTSVLHKYLNLMTTRGTTNMADGILLATEKLSGKRDLRAMVIITDGMPQNREEALSAARKAKKEGIRIITIGTDDADKDFLEQLASETNLGVKIRRVQLEKTIASASKLLLDKGRPK